MNITNDEVIELKDISYTKDGIHIIKNISGSFTRGKITTIVGPSGAGKTTLFRLLNGLIPPTNGDIFIYRQSIKHYEPTELRRVVGLALQKATMLSGTVYKNIALPKTLQGEKLAKEEAVKYLNSVGLGEELLNRDVEDISGGQRQRVSIARTLVNEPKILLLDEITSSLDKVSKQEIEKLIVHINQTFDVTILWITHNLQQAINIGHDTWVLMNGELLESGKSNLLIHPATDEVKHFVQGEFE